MAGNLEPQDCYSASALMQLGGGRDHDHIPDQQQHHATQAGHGSAAQASPTNLDVAHAAASAAVPSVVNVGHPSQQPQQQHHHHVLGGMAADAAHQQAPWPLMIFDMGQCAGAPGGA
jgi:hypothetical protein